MPALDFVVDRRDLRVTALSEMYRVLRPGGTLVVAEARIPRHGLLRVLARLKPGQTVPTAQAEMDVVTGQLSQEHKENAGLGARVEAIPAAPGDRQFELARAVTAMRAALGIPPGAPATTA